MGRKRESVREKNIEKGLSIFTFKYVHLLVNFHKDLSFFSMLAYAKLPLSMHQMLKCFRINNNPNIIVMDMNNK